MTNQQIIYSAQGYAIHLADLPRHRDIISTIWQGGEQNASRADKLDLYYSGNPAGAPVIFLLWSDEEKKHVGVLCTAPRVFFSGSKRLIGAVFADLFVEPSHRTLGPSAILLKQAKAYLLGEVDFVYGFMNPMATLVGKRVGLTFREPAQQLVFPLSVAHHIRKRIPGAAGSLLGQALHYPFVILTWVVCEFFTFFFKESVIDLSELFIDVEQLSCDSNDTVIGERTLEFINWRLKKNSNDSYLYYGIEDKKGQLGGYISYSSDKNDRVHIHDVIAANPLAFKALIMGFSKKMMKMGHVSIQVTLLSESKESSLIKRLGFKNSGELTFFCNWAEKHANTLATRSMYLTSADNDV